MNGDTASVKVGVKLGVKCVDKLDFRLRVVTHDIL